MTAKEEKDDLMDLARRVVSRRVILKGLAAFATLPIVAACAAEAPPTATPAPKPPAAPPTQAAAAPAPTQAAAAPAPTKPAPAAAQPAAPVSKAEIRMHSRTGTEGTKPEAAIAAFEKNNPDVAIKLETFPPGE